MPEFTVIIDDHGHVHSTDPSKHVHVCADGCGDFWVCSQRDGCPNTWICPACEQARLDHYVDILSQKEPHADHC